MKDKPVTLSRIRYTVLIFSFVIVGFFLYAHVLDGEFVSDDCISVVENTAVRHVHDLGKIWQAFNTRSLVGWSFAVNYHLHGLNVWGYHLVNIVLHIINTLLVFVLVHNTLVFCQAYQPLPDKMIPSIAYFAALIFLTHPIQTQGVAYITQRAVLLGTLFYIGALVSYILYRRKKKPAFLGLSFLCMLGGVISKENIATLPFMILLYDFFFIKKGEEKTTGILRHAIPYVLGFALLITLFFLDRPGSVLQIKSDLSAKMFNWKYFLTEINVLRTYLRLIIFPVGQNHHYDYKIVQNVLELRTVLSFGLLLGLILWAVWVFPRARILSFGIAWYFVTTSVELATVSIVQRKVIDEHWLYLPMVGASLFLAYAFFLWLKDVKRYRVLMSLIVIVLSLMTYQRNFVWQTEIGFWEDVYRKAPRQMSSYLGLGQAYQRKNDLVQAEKIYRAGLKINPRSTVILNNLGIIYATRGQTDQAIGTFQEILKIEPKFFQIHNNLAFAYYNKGSYAEAIKTYQHYISLRKNNPTAYEFLGKSYLGVGDQQQAALSIQKALNLYQERKNIQKITEMEQLLKTIKER